MTPTPKKIDLRCCGVTFKTRATLREHFKSEAHRRISNLLKGRPHSPMEAVQYVKDLSHTMQLIIKEVDDLKTALAVRTKELEESKRRESKLKEELQLQKHLVRVARQGPLRNGDEEDEDEEDEDESDVSLDTSIPAPKTCLRKRK